MSDSKLNHSTLEDPIAAPGSFIAFDRKIDIEMEVKKDIEKKK